ncbi:hypothetical protein [Aquimarina addita]
MKKIILLLVILGAINISCAQKSGSRERIRTFKIAYITEQLNLTSTEAQKFWPVYNEHHNSMESLRKQERSSLKIMKETESLDNINDTEAEKLINIYLDIEEQRFLAKEKLIKKLKSIIPQNKIIKLLKTESDFNRRLLKQLRDRNRGQ